MDRRVAELQDEQGWSDISLLVLAHEFIDATNLEDAYVRFLERQAEKENR